MPLRVDMSFGRRSFVPLGTFIHLFPSGKRIPSLSHVPGRSAGPPFGEKSSFTSLSFLTSPVIFQRSDRSGRSVQVAPPPFASYPVISTFRRKVKLHIFI